MMARMFMIYLLKKYGLVSLSWQKVYRRARQTRPLDFLPIKNFDLCRYAYIFFCHRGSEAQREIKRFKKALNAVIKSFQLRELLLFRVGLASFFHFK